ncbi:MAG: PAS domain S-box protein [Cyanobacteria bacterium P01_D01_bin.1]
MSVVPLETLFDVLVALVCCGLAASTCRLAFSRFQATQTHLFDSRSADSKLPSQTSSPQESADRNQPSTAIFQKAVEHTAGGLIICDAQKPGLPIVYASPNFESLTGYLKAEVIGRSYRFLPGEETGQVGLETISKAVTSGTDCKVLLQLYRKNRHAFWSEVTFSPIKDDDGTITHYVSTQIDISHYLDTFRALQKSEVRYRHLYEETPAMLHSVDAQGLIVGTSNYWLEKLGYEREDVIGQPLLSFVAEGCKQKVSQVTATLSETALDRDRRCQFLKKDGSRLDVLLSTTVECDEEGGSGSTLGVLVDITERRKAQKKLNRNSALLRAVNDMPPTGVFVMDCHTDEALFVNSEFYRIWQLEHLQTEVVQGKLNGEQLLTECLSTVDLERFVAASTAQDFTSNKTVEDEVPLLDGRTLRRIYGPVQQDNSTFAYLYMFEDITERKQAVQELALATKAAETANLAKSEFLANMSHELRSPLNAILGFTHILRESNPKPDQAENLDIIYRSGEHLLALINDVLDISKIEAGRVELTCTEFDLYCLLDELQQMFSSATNKKDLQFSVVRSPELPQIIFSDRLKLRQILINLLSNAVKFTAAGTITLSVDSKRRETEPKENSQTGTDRQSSNFQTDTKPTARLTFAVRDTGSGIAAAEQIHLFKAFVQTQSGLGKNDGTGLGLSISHEYIQLLGGSLSVDSELGKGSTFLFDISVAVVEDVVAPPPTTAKPMRRVVGLAPGQPARRILVVDDVAINRKLLSHLLTNVGFDVREAENGQAAIALWQSWRPHLVWMDIRMPVMTGEEATTRIKALEETLCIGCDHQTRIIALTANAFAEDRAAAIASGCDDFVSKPIKANEIFDKLAQHLGVRYEYASPSPAPQPTAPALTPELFIGTSDSWRYNLTQAILDLDDDTILDLLTQLPDDQKPLALAIEKGVKELDYKKLLEVIEQSSSVGVTS